MLCVIEEWERAQSQYLSVSFKWIFRKIQTKPTNLDNSFGFCLVNLGPFTRSKQSSRLHHVLGKHNVTTRITYRNEEKKKLLNQNQSLPKIWNFWNKITVKYSDFLLFPLFFSRMCLFVGASVRLLGSLLFSVYLIYQKLTNNFTKSRFHFIAYVAILLVHILWTLSTLTRTIFRDITIVFGITAKSTSFTKLQNNKNTFLKNLIFIFFLFVKFVYNSN